MKTIFFQSPEIFARMEALATMLANSSFGVPEAYRGDVGSCFNAVDIAYRLGVSPLVVLQNSREIDGKPAFTYQFAKALIEDSGLITSLLQYETEGELRSDGQSGEGPAYRIRAYGETSAGTRLYGPWINWKMAQMERWTDNPAYISMPEVMFRARATTFFFNQHCSSLLMGFQIEGDPAIGASKNAPATASLTDFKLPAAATEAAGDHFATALSATTTADPVAVVASAAQSIQAATADVKAESNGSIADTASTKPASPAESPKPRGRKPKGADPAPQSTTPAAEKQTQPQPLLTETPPATLATDQASEQQSLIHDGISDSEGQQNLESDTPATLPPMAEQGTQSAGQREAFDNFSIAFAKVDALAPSGESLKECMALANTFAKEEANDLYLVLLSNAERILTGFVGTGRNLTAEEGAFAAAVRELYSATKEQASQNTDLNDRRKDLYGAYTGLLAHLNKTQAAASA